VRSIGEIEERAQAAAHRRGRERKARRLGIALAVALVLAGAVGVWLGFGSHATPEEMADEINRAAEPSRLSEEDLLRRELIRSRNQPSPGGNASPIPGSRP
jgi:hypothetical protein